MGFWQVEGVEEGPGEITDIADLAGNWPAHRVSGRKKAVKNFYGDYDLFWAEPEIPGFRKKMYIPEDGLVLISWQLKVQHRGIDAGAPWGKDYPIGLGARPWYRRASTEAGLTGTLTRINEGLAAGQLMDWSKHRFYTLEGARIPFPVNGPYWYEFSLGAGSHTSAGTRNGADGSAELAPSGNNYLMLEYEPGAALEA
jgi:hypothetical protein